MERILITNGKNSTQRQNYTLVIVQLEKGEQCDPGDAG